MRHDHVPQGLIVLALLLWGCPPAPEAKPPAPEPTAAPSIEPTEAEEPTEDEDVASDMRVTESGLGIEDLKVGGGKEAAEGDEVTVHYVGRLESGKEIDNSRKRHEPYTFKVGHGKVIAGWDEGVVGMKVGGKRRLTVPAKLGYGERGRMPTIPPNALLEFEIELVAVE